MTFRITGSGLYVNRKGERVEVVSRLPAARASDMFKWVGVGTTPNYAYTDGGFVDGWGSPGNHDIVGVWEEPSARTLNVAFANSITDEMVSNILRETECRCNKTSSYDLTKVSQRFKALEDGRSIQYLKTVVTPDQLYLAGMFILHDEGPWSLVPHPPRTNKWVTKLWVYANTTFEEPWHLVERSEVPNPHQDCLGAIEGSEQVSEVEV